MIESKKLFIASEVRSGSTYAAELLAYAFQDKLGIGLWDLTRELLSDISYKSTVDEIITAVRKIWINEAGFRAAKIMCAQLSVLCHEACENHSLSEMLFNKDAYWLILRRRERIPQAVSLAFARKDGIFHAYTTEFEAPVFPPDVTMPDIDDALKAIALSDLYLETFAMKPARHMTVFYEDLMNDKSGFICDVATFIGMSVDEVDFGQLTAPRLIPTNRDPKNGKVEQFRAWLLGNYHDLR